MQLHMLLQPNKPLVIPYNYHYPLQSALYALLGTVGESWFWHNCGFGDVTKYKGFCFGRLEGDFQVDRERQKLCFAGAVSLEVRSPSFAFIDGLQRAVEQHPRLRLYDTELAITDAALANLHLTSGSFLAQAVTPVAIHQTLPDGHTRYFSPEEADFTGQLGQNLARKFEAITGQQAEQAAIIPCGSFRKVVTKYKNIYITGYTGAFHIDTSVLMAEFIYNAGLGEKNAQGFGFVRLPD